MPPEGVERFVVPPDREQVPRRHLFQDRPGERVDEGQQPRPGVQAVHRVAGQPPVRVGRAPERPVDRFRVQQPVPRGQGLQGQPRFDGEAGDLGRPHAEFRPQLAVQLDLRVLGQQRQPVLDPLRIAEHVVAEHLQVFAEVVGDRALHRGHGLLGRHAQRPEHDEPGPHQRQHVPHPFQLGRQVGQQPGAGPPAEGPPVEVGESLDVVLHVQQRVVADHQVGDRHRALHLGGPVTPGIEGDDGDPARFLAGCGQLRVVGAEPFQHRFGVFALAQRQFELGEQFAEEPAVLAVGGHSGTLRGKNALAGGFGRP
ncbi:hypothetical protein [Amycolatopsis sp. NPDC051102]|uniref:hypothetical protein n=1 Tax=Amycolatopsis sp. NPDC051102 TaxID=3155163 RepID=UPI0034143808